MVSRHINGLADFGYKKHYRIKHGENEFAKGNHINGISINFLSNHFGDISFLLHIYAHYFL